MIIADTAKKIVKTAGDAVLLTLSKAWIGIGAIRPARTDRYEEPVNPKPSYQRIDARTQRVDRFDYENLCSLQLGEFFMPLSQTFSLRSKKRTNVSSLVDGIDIIQQTRKEAKMIDCTLRISYKEDRPNLHIVDEDAAIQKLSWFLTDLYETDAVFSVSNDMINNTFGVTHVMMTEYKFTPRVSMGTYTFEFSLMEVKYGENVLTFDLKQVDAAPRQLIN